MKKVYNECHPNVLAAFKIKYLHHKKYVHMKLLLLLMKHVFIFYLGSYDSGLLFY